LTNFVQANRLKTFLQILVILFAVLRLGNYFYPASAAADPVLRDHAFGDRGILYPKWML